MNTKLNRCVKGFCWLFIGSVGIAANAALNAAHAQRVGGLGEQPGPTLLMAQGTHPYGGLLADDEGTDKIGGDYSYYRPRRR